MAQHVWRWTKNNLALEQWFLLILIFNSPQGLSLQLIRSIRGTQPPYKEMGAAKVDVASSMEDDSIQPDNLSKDTKMKTRDQDGRENSISISPGVSLVRDNISP